MLIAGIDPGIEGAVALLEYAGLDVRLLDVVDMPFLELSRGRKSRREIDVHALAAIFRERPPNQAYLERAGARPRQGVSSSFRYGDGYGAIRGVLVALNIPLTRVDPGIWKRTLSVPAAKDGARARASELFPGQSGRWRLVKHHGRAESALIALYGAKVLNRIRPGREAAQ
jgi:crossover junction endodeoxyribonuclease RuvC